MLKPRSRGRRLRLVLALWIAALPVLVGIMYITAVTSSDDRDRFYGTSGALFIGGVLLLPWIIGIGLLAWLAFRRRPRDA